MTLWIGLVVVTLVAVALLWFPLRRRAEHRDGAIAYDRELYLARLREIDTDLALGRIGTAEAEAAKAEEGRKLIALAENPLPAAPMPPARSRTALIAVCVLVPLFSIPLYFVTGVPGMRDMAAATRPDRDVSQQSIEQLLQRAEAQLSRNPSDLQGWTVVGPVYVRLGRFEDAVLAWRNAVRLAPENPEFRLNLAEAMTAAAQGVVNEDARREFETVIAARPRDAKARFYLAIALGQQGDNEAAVKAWQALIAEAPGEAPWLPVAKDQLQRAQARIGGGAGPSAEDVEAAASLSTEDRRSMIEGMVAGLADKLKADPADREGWKRLIRAYGVLGKREEMSKAVVAAKDAHGSDAAFVADIESIAAEFAEGGNQ